MTDVAPAAKAAAKPPASTASPVKLFTLYSKQTGAIVGSAGGAANCETTTIGQIEGSFAAAGYYVSSASGTATAVPRTAMGVTIDRTAVKADGADQATLSNVPPGAALAIDGASQGTVTDGSVEFTTSHAGTFTIALTGVPWLPASFDVVAT